MNVSAEVGAGVVEGVGEVWSLGLECQTDEQTGARDRLLRFVLHGVLLNLLGGGGLLGNALAVLVLSRPQMRSSVNCLLVGLAAADTVLILTSVLLFGLSAVYPYTGLMRYYYYRVCPLLTPYAFPLALVAQTMSVYLTLIVTVERWVAVCHPFRAKALCTSARARWYVLGTLLFSLVYNAPRFLEVAVERVEDAAGTDYVYCVTATELRTPLYVTVYIHWLYLVVMYIVPFSLLAVLNACIVRQVRRAQAERARLSRVQRRELGLATMLLVVVLVFFLCNLLPLFTNAFEVFLGEEFEHLDPLVKTSNLLVMINSSVNFVIYVIFGEKFKRVFLKMFCGRRGWVAWDAAGRGTRGGGAGGRDSPDHTRDDSFASCNERISLRLVRNGTLRRSALGMGTGAGAMGARGGRGGARASRPVFYPGGGTELTTLSVPESPGPPAPPAAPAPSPREPPPAAARWNGHAGSEHF